MSSILDDGLREQLAAALLGWGGDNGTRRDSRNSRDTIDSHDNEHGRETPKPEPGLGHRRGYIRGLMEYADEEDTTTTNDDIDADSVLDTGDAVDTRHEDDLRFQQPRRTAERPAPPAQKALPPRPDELPLASPPPEMSCRLSRFPFAHPCEVPELMPDQEDMFGAATSPSVSGPATPSVIPDVFLPLTKAISPEVVIGPLPNPASDPESHSRMRSMSTNSIQSDATDGLGIIREESDANTDGVSLLTPTEVSYAHGPGDGSGSPRADGQTFLTAGQRGHWRSVSSLGSGSSGEWRPSNVSATSRRSNLFSRIRNGGRPVEEEFLEKRSLTPMQLSAPLQPGQLDDEHRGPNPPTPTSPSFSFHRAETSATARFFNRMPWLSDSQARKPEVVFGVDLKESIRVAPMKIRISHKGRSTSYRTFPVAVYKCCEFIRRAGGTDAHIFSSPGDMYNVSSLKSIFSLPPTFGEDFQFEGSDYTVHDAARLILEFLEALPKPLISPSVVKSWILLARQEGAIEPPCPRVETGLDFWTEALNRLPTANRNLTKHLLTLFAEVLLAASGTISEADARQLASSVSRAMLHQDVEPPPGAADQRKKPAKRNVQPTLALAFLIKKRGEYAISLGRAVDGATKAKRDSKMFLPSTKEIMEWKGVGPRP